MMDFSNPQHQNVDPHLTRGVHVGVQCQLSDASTGKPTATDVHGTAVGGKGSGASTSASPSASVSPSTSAATSEDPMSCRVCGVGGESREWVGCEKCEHWFHLKCIGIILNPGTNATVFIKKFHYLCPTHVQQK